MTDFETALIFIRREECSPRCLDGFHAACFTDVPDDPGGATCCGILQRTYSAWRVTKGQEPQSVADHSWEEHSAIYWERFWQRGACEKLAWPLSLLHFDACVNHGTEPKDAEGRTKMNAGRLLQRALLLDNSELDGIVGPQTVQLTTLTPMKELCARYLLERFFRYDKLVDQNPRLSGFLTGGWEKRLEALYKEVFSH